MATSESTLIDTSTQLSSRTAFISGHIDLPEPEFLQHYATMLNTAISSNDNFILSNSLGADTLALNYLLPRNVDPSRITIYLHTKRTKENINSQKFIEMGLKVVIVDGGHTERDTEMTKVSDYDVAWVRSEEETRKLYGRKYRVGRVSGTRKNLDRRIEQQKK